MKTLPVCSERKINYATFTIVDIEIGGKTRILEYDNPPGLIISQNKLYNPKWEELILEGNGINGRKLRSCEFYPRKEDRILLYSDGITQSGLGTDMYPFGWGVENANAYALQIVQNTPGISAILHTYNKRYQLQKDPADRIVRLIQKKVMRFILSLVPG